MGTRLQSWSQAAVLAVACMLLSPSSACGEEAGFVDAWTALGVRTVEELETLAEASHTAKLYAWRNAAYELVLLFEPEHAKARKWLKYRRAAAGGWKRGAYKPPRNLKPPSEDMAAQRKGLADRFADAAFALLEKHSASLTPALEQETLRIVVRFTPEREDVRDALGEVRTKAGAWRLAESLAAPARREALRKLAASSLARAPAPQAVRPTTEDNRLRLGWTAIYQAPHVRLMGTVTKDELLLGVKRIEACFPTVEAVFGVKTTKVKPLTIYLLAGSSDRDAILKHHPKATEAYRTWARRLQASWLPKANEIWIHARNKPLRLEWCSRQAMGHLLASLYGIRGTPGWAFEGCGLYLSNLIAGQRRTFFVKRTQYGEKGTRKDDLWERLLQPETDWREEARVLLASDRAPDLRLLLGKKLNAMNTEDMLASFALCAFLIEGRHNELPALLEAIGRGKQKPEAVLGRMGLDRDTLDIKLRRWLEETR